MANEKEISTRIQLKNDTEANWKKSVLTTDNSMGTKEAIEGARSFVPRNGEVIIFKADENYSFPRIKIGDGVTNVLSLPFATGVTSVNGEIGDITLEDLGLDKPLNFVGIVNANETAPSQTVAPTITTKNNYEPKIGDVIIYQNGNEYICVDIIEEENNSLKYIWEQLGQNTSVVTQINVQESNHNKNYPLLFSPVSGEVIGNDTIVDSTYKNNSFTYNPIENNLSLIRKDGNTIIDYGKINNHSIGAAFEKDFIDYNTTYFPNGLNFIGKVNNISGGGISGSSLEAAYDNTPANVGDLVYIEEINNENQTIKKYYGCAQGKIWVLLTPVEISPESDRLTTERTLYYYKGSENIRTVGTISSGTWEGNIVDVQHGGTGQNQFDNFKILYGNGTGSIQSGLLAWKNWEENSDIGPKAVLQIGNTLNSELTYTSTSIPTADEEKSGVVIAIGRQYFGGNKFFSSGQLGIKTKNSNLNKIIFGTQTPIQSTGVESPNYITPQTEEDEWASINVKIPSKENIIDGVVSETQFSFKQYGFSETENNNKLEYTRMYYEEYLLPKITNENLNKQNSSNKTYTIITSKNTRDGALFVRNDDEEPIWGILPIAQGGTGATTLFAAKANLGFGVEAHDFTLSNFLGLKQHWGIGAVVQSAEVGEEETDKAFLNKKTFLILTDSGLLSYNTTDSKMIWEFNLNSSNITATVYNNPIESNPGEVKASYKILHKPNDENAIGSATKPIYIDENGLATACGNTLNINIEGNVTGNLTGDVTGHASLDLPLTGGTLTNTLTVQTGGIWIQGGSDAGSNNTRMGLTGGMPDKFPYNQSKRGVYIYSNAIAFADPYNGNSGNDSGWLRHIEETANSGVLELGVGDDGNESIVVRQYNTSSAIVRTATLLDASGNTSFPGTTTTTNLYINGGNGSGIYYAGTKATYRIIRFIDNTSDTYGNGISIGAGG